MAAIPEIYRWLEQCGSLPVMMRAALALLGTVEAPGEADNPVILGWAEELGGTVARDYRVDSIPWCGLFMAVVAQRAAKPLPEKPLWALDWARFGVAAAIPALGDVLVFRRSGGGHVGLYVGEDPDAYHVLGGNQNDRVGFTRIARSRSRLHAARRPAYRRRPASAVPVRLLASGALSVNEA